MFSACCQVSVSSWFFIGNIELKEVEILNLHHPVLKLFVLPLYC
jgi:hypothetical protein